MAISDSKKKQIIADYVSTKNYTETAKKFGVSNMSVKRITDKELDFVNRCEEKKKETEESVIDHFLGLAPQINEFMNRAMAEILKRDKLEISTMSQITTAMGTLLDKITMLNDMKQVTTEEEDDPITKALKERASSIKGEDNADK